MVLVPLLLVGVVLAALQLLLVGVVLAPLHLLQVRGVLKGVPGVVVVQGCVNVLEVLDVELLDVVGLLLLGMACLIQQQHRQQQYFQEQQQQQAAEALEAAGRVVCLSLHHQVPLLLPLPIAQTQALRLRRKEMQIQKAAMIPTKRV